MGCTPSKPVSPREESHDEVPNDSKGLKSKPNTGGWMEKSPDKDMKGQNVRIHAEGGSAGPDADGGSFTAAELGKGGTRARRLSYITPDQNMLNRLREEYAKNYLAPEGSNHSQPVVLQHGADSHQQQPQQEKRASLDIALRVSAMCMTGQEAGFKKVCQDANFAFDTFIAEGTGQAVFGAMDGHGPQGHLVAGALKRHLPHILAEHIARGGDLEQAMKTGFLQADRLLASSNVDCQYSGSTCSVAYLQGNQLTVAWVGDSRVVLGKQANGRWTAADLSIDHKPTLNEERNRIWKAGGRIEGCLNEENDPVGPYRVWLQESWVPGLAMMLVWHLSLKCSTSNWARLISLSYWHRMVCGSSSAVRKLWTWLPNAKASMQLPMRCVVRHTRGGLMKRRGWWMISLLSWWGYSTGTLAAASSTTTS